MKSRTFNKSFKKVLCWIMMTGIIFFTSDVRIGEAKNKKENINKATIKNPIVLISQAVKKGILDEETALVYKHYALFRPQSLPHEFVVEDPVLIKSGTPLLDETYERWEGLSPSAKKKINSIYEDNERGISPGNAHVPYLPYAHPTAGHFVIYYELDPANVNRISPTDSDWQSYTDTNGNGRWDLGEPLNDDVGIDGQPNTGDLGEGDGQPNPTEAFQDDNGNGIRDIGEDYLDEYDNNQWDSGEPHATPDYVENLGEYLEKAWNGEVNLGYIAPPVIGRMKAHIFSMGGYGVTYTGPNWGLSENISEIGVDNDMIGVPENYDPEGTVKGAMKVTAAHEFFHTIQHGPNYDRYEDTWWKEASATWMEDVVYDQVNDYINYYNGQNYDWFNHPELSLNHASEDVSDFHKYGSSIFAKYLSEHKGSNDIIRQIWDNCNTDDSLDAIAKALGDPRSFGENFQNVFKEFTVTNFIKTGIGGYEEGSSYPDIKIEASYPSSAEPNQHFVGKAPLPTKYGDKLYMLDDKQLPHLASHYLKFTPPEQLDKPTKLYINFKKGPGSPKTWGTKLVLVQNNNEKIVKEITKEDNEKGTCIFSCAFGLTRDNPKDTEIKEVLLIPSNLDQRSDARKYQYSAVVIPQFEDVYTPNPNSGTSKTVYNFDPDNVYKNGDTIHLEVNLSYKAKVTADFSEVDVNFNPDNVIITESDPIEHKYEITYTIDTAVGENGLPVKIKAQDLTGTGFNIDETFLVNQALLVITVIYPQDGETIFERRPTIVAEITSLIGVEIDLSSIMMTLDTSVVEHNWRALSPDRSSVEIYYTPTEDLSYDQHTVTVDAKDINGLAAEQKVWTFIIEEMPWRFKVTPAYMLSGESAIVSLRSLENTPTKTVRYTPGKITNVSLTDWGPERYITLTNQGKDGNFFLYTGTITPSDYLDGYRNDGSGSGELYCNDGGTIRKCSLGISDVLTTADIVIEEVSPIFQKPDGPYVTVTGYFRQFAWAGGSMCGMILSIQFINYDEYLQFAERGGGSYGTVWEDAQHIKYMWLRATLDVKLHEGENLIQIYHIDASSEYYLSEDIRYVGASTIVNVPSGVCTSQVAARNISQVAADVSGPDPTFKLGEVYSFPNPAKRGKCPTIHIESGIADRVEINIYDIAGELVHSSEITDKPEIINGKYAYEYRWNVSNVASGVYIYLIRARKSGEKEIKVVKRLAIVK